MIFAIIAVVIILVGALWYKKIMPDAPPLQTVPQFDNLEVIKTGTITVVKPATTEVATGYVAHNLGYLPGIIAFSTNDLGLTNQPLPISVPATNAGTSTGQVAYSCNANVDITNVDVLVYTPNWTTGSNSSYTNAITVTVRYYLLRLPAI